MKTLLTLSGSTILMLLVGCAHPAGRNASVLEIPEFRPCRSKTIAAVRYVDQDLDLKFTDGCVQRYSQVPETLARDFWEGDEKYGYFLRNIKPYYERTVLAKSYQNRSARREIVQVHSNWLEGSQELGYYTVRENGMIVRGTDGQDRRAPKTLGTLSQR